MPPKRNRFFTCLGCVIAGPLGCLAFVGGGVLVGIYFLPRVFEDVGEREISNVFREVFRGDLDVGSLELSWTSTQEVDDLVLRDPEGRMVGRADLRVPPLLDFLDETEFGEVVVVDLELHVVADEQGGTNLGRAFESREDVAVDTAEYDARELWRFVTRDLFHRKGSVRVELRELEVVSQAALAGDAPLRFTGLEATFVYGTGEPLDLRIVDSTGSGALTLEAKIALEAFEPSGNGDPGISGRFRASRVPTELVAAFSDTLAPLRRLFGAHMDVAVELDTFAVGRAPLRVFVGSDATELELRGALTATGLATLDGASADLEFDADLRLPAPVADELSNGLLEFDWLGEAEPIPAGDAEPIRVGDVELAWSRGEAFELAGDGFTIDVPPLAVRRRGDAESIALRGAKLVGSRGSDSSFTIRCETVVGTVESPEPLAIVLSSTEPVRVLARDKTAGFALSADGHVPLADVDRLLGLGGTLARDSNEFVQVHAAIAHGESAWPLEVAIRSESVAFELEGTLTGSPFAGGDPWGALDFAARLEEFPGSLLAPLLPAGIEIDWSGSAEPVAIAYEGWRVRAAEAPVASLDPPGPPGSGDELTERSGGSATITAPRCALRTARLAERGLALELVDAVFSARGDSSALLVDLTARSMEGGGALEGHGVFRGVAGPFGLDGFERAELEAHARLAPTALLDAELAAQGLFSAVFGPEAALDLDAKNLSAPGGRVRLVASSPRAHGELAGLLERGVQVSGATATLDCELDEAAFARVLAPLVPLLASAQPEPAGGRFTLALEGGVLPLDGDVERITGACRIDLDGARVALAPELLAFLVLPADGDVAAAVTAPIALQLSGGRVSATELSLSLPSGPSFSVEGGFDLDGTDIDLQTELPLRVLGPEVSPILHGMSGLLRPEMSVPVVVRGDVGALSMSVRPQWIRTVGDVLGELVPDVLKESLKKLASEER